MTQQVFTIGYSGIKIERLTTIVNTLGAVLIDIRFRAGSRRPEWNKGKLSAVFGPHYMHLPALGNAAYRSGGLQIANYAAGKAAIEGAMQTLGKPVVLMCACGSPVDCHRTYVAGLLRADQFEVQELSPSLIEEVLGEEQVAARPVPAKYPQLSFWGQEGTLG